MVLALFFALIATFSAIVSIYAQQAHAAVNSTINFQARVLQANGAVVADGNYSVQFKLYDAVTGGTNEWTETQNIAAKNGYITASLGSVTSFPGTIDWSQEHWLTMNINGDGEMGPTRMKITAVPYSFKSGQADSLTNGAGTISASQLAQLAPGSIQSVNSGNAALRVNQTGAGDLLQLQGDGVNSLTVTKGGDVTVAKGITLGPSTLTTAGTLRWSGVDFEGYDGSQWVSLTSGSGVGGSANQLTVIKAAPETVTNSAALQNDNELLFPIGANESWAFRFVVQANAGTQPDIQFAVTAPTGATCTVGVLDAEGAVAVGNLGCGVTSGLVTGNGTADVYEITGSVTNGTTPGNVTLQWAQNAANATATTVYAGSYVVATSTTAGGGLEFVQGGNAFGNTAVLGTTDAFGMSLVTSGLSRLTVSATGAVSVGQDLTVGTGLTVSAGGLVVTGGADLNNGGITDTGNILGVGNSISAAAGLTISTAAGNSLELDSGNGILVLHDATLQRTAAGTTLIDLSDTADTLLSIVNSDASAVAGLEVEGAVVAQGFTGDGSLLTNIDADNITTGTLVDSVLSSNVSLLNATQTFTALNTFNSGLIVGNTTNTTAGAIRWNGVDFEGYNGTGWVSFTTGGGGGGGAPGSVVSKIKPTDETVNNSATLQNDDDLSFAIEANDEWTFRFIAQANSGVAPGLQFAVTAPAGAICDISYIDAEGSVTASNVGCGATSGLMTGNGTTDVYEIVGSIRNGATAGDVQLQWAQNTVDISNTTIYAGSYVNAIPVSGGVLVPTNAFVQGGNSFGATAILGTADANGLELRTNGLTGLSLSSSGDTTIAGLTTTSGNLVANADTLLNGDVFIGDTATDTLTIRSDALLLPNGLDIDNGTLVINSTTNNIGINASASNKLTINSASTADSTAEVLIYTNNNNQKGLVIQTTSGQIANIFEAQNSGGTALIAIDKDGRLALGNDSATPQAGLISFNDITTANGFTSVLGTSVLTASRSINLPDEDGTLCIRGSAACGFIMLASGSAQTDSTANASIFINKTGASGDIMTLQKGGATVFSVLNSGALQLQLTDASAFSVSNAGGTAQFFNIDTTGTGIVRIGGSAADASATLFVLDAKNTAGDPAGTNGGMYYNSADNKNRCYENGVWTDCTNLVIAGETTLGTALGTINVNLNGSYEYLQCRVDIKGKSASSMAYLRFNNDAGLAAYSWNQYGIPNNAVTDTQDNSDSEIQLPGTVSSTAPFSANLNITNFSDTRKGVDWTAIGIDPIGTNATRYSGAGVWDNASSSISSVQIVASGGTFNAGSHVWCQGRNIR